MFRLGEGQDTCGYKDYTGLSWEQNKRGILDYLVRAQTVSTMEGQIEHEIK